MKTRQCALALVPLTLLVSAFAMFGSTACRSDSAERAGERIDEAANDTKRAIEDAAD